MIDLEDLREELRSGLADLNERQKQFVDTMVAKIEKTEQNLLFEQLTKMNLRLVAIEEKLAEKDVVPEEGDDDDRPKVVKDRF